MKKQYIEPTIDEIVFKTSGIIATSPGQQSSEEANTDSDGNYTDPARQSDFFDDDF